MVALVATDVPQVRRSIPRLTRLATLYHAGRAALAPGGPTGQRRTTSSCWTFAASRRTIAAGGRLTRYALFGRSAGGLDRHRARADRSSRVCLRGYSRTDVDMLATPDRQVVVKYGRGPLTATPCGDARASSRRGRRRDVAHPLAAQPSWGFDQKARGPGTYPVGRANDCAAVHGRHSRPSGVHRARSDVRKAIVEVA